MTWGITVSLEDYRIIFLLNRKTRIAVNTPYGQTEAFELDELVRQGSVLGAVISAKCQLLQTAAAYWAQTEHST